MKSLIYGAGVLGSLLASKLKQAGKDVTILARGNRLKEINHYGIVINDLSIKTTTSTKIDTIDSKLTEKDNFDLIVVIIPKNAIEVVLPDLAKYSTNATLLLMGNNGTALEQYQKILDPKRIILGFFSAAGKRNGHEMQVVFDEKLTPIRMGEISGDVSPRTKKLQEYFESSKIQVKISPNIDAWLKMHIAWVSPLANLYYLLKQKNSVLTENSPELDIAINAVIEGIKVLEALNYPILPESYKTDAATPKQLGYRILGMFQWKWFEIALKGHVEQAVDEMKRLADEFQTLIQKTNIPTPNINLLYNALPKKG